MTIGDTTVRHNLCGGLIYPSDFETYYEGTRNMAERIASDWRFDELCRKNAKNRDKNKKCMEELDV